MMRSSARGYHELPGREVFPAALAMLAALFLFAGQARAGFINVGSTADGAPANDSVITLREGLMIANGTRTPWNHPDPDIVDEVSHINGSVGAGIADTINVTVGAGATILLGSLLPPLNDSTDSIQADSETVIDASGLSVTSSDHLFDLTTPGHAINGLTIQGYPRTPVRVTAAGNTMNAMMIRNSGENGMMLSGDGADGNTISNCVIEENNGFGIVLINGPSGNTIRNSFVHGNAGTGVWLTGAGTNGNFLYGCGIGVDKDLARDGNQGVGVLINDGAKTNRFGNPAALSTFSYISFNALGGVRITGAGTDGNILHSLWLGHDKDDPSGSGNGDGAGIEVRNGAKNNQIGQPGMAPFIVLGGHTGSAVLVTGEGTDGNNIQRVFVGGPNPNVLGAKIQNHGHGVEIADGVQDMFIGGPVELTQVEIDYSGPALGPRHGIYLNGNNASRPIRDIRLGVFHFGNQRRNESAAIFTGDVIRIEGNVKDVVIGQPGHPNHINGAAGWGVNISGDEVENVELHYLFVGDYFGEKLPNEMGGIRIADGASSITLSPGGTQSHSAVLNNGGPGILIDASAKAPEGVTIQNCSIGISPIETADGNQAEGIYVKGMLSTEPTTLTQVQLGSAAAPGLGNVISGNLGHGIRLENVAGVKIHSNLVGTRHDGSMAVGIANQGSGISIERANRIEIGDAASAMHGNTISGNMQHGVAIERRGAGILVMRNIIGLTADGGTAFGNGGDGIHMRGPAEGAADMLDGTMIGRPDAPDAYNVISGNTGNGIALDNVAGVKIFGNRIGVNGAGDTRRANGENGILIEDAKQLEIGIAPPVYGGNIISGNAKAGIRLAGQPSDLKIQHNTLGLNLDQLGKLPNDGDGILVDGPAQGDPVEMTGVKIGGKDAQHLGNTIAGNTGSGIRVVNAAKLEIYANRIGTDDGGNLPFANGEDGVRIGGGREIDLGAGAPDYAGNVISGNTGAGVRLTSGTSEMRIHQNRIGLNLAGTGALPNSGAGLVYSGPNPPAGRPLLIGGASNAVNVAGGALEEGNLISGNSGPGVRIVGAGDSEAVRLEGNLIGVGNDGEQVVRNEGPGILVENIFGVTIGHWADPRRRNVISGNKEEGVRVEGAAAFVELHRNRIGSGADIKKEAPNERHGIWFRGGATDSVISANTIRYNKENGVRISEAATRRVRLTQNLIHRNVKEGILVEDGANNGIEPPTVRRSDPHELVGSIEGSSGTPGGTVEIFVDPLPKPMEDGYFGQGDQYVRTVAAGADGAFTVDHSGSRKGILTATITDGEGNTSAFSPVLEGMAIQVVKTKDDLLVANKPTVVRVYGDTGINSLRRDVTGELRIDGAAPLAPTPAKFVMRSLKGYSAMPEAKRRAENSMNFYIDKPAEGAHTFDVTLMDGTMERGKLALGPFNFQRIEGITFGFVLVSAPNSSGTLPLETASLAHAVAVFKFFFDLFPLDPNGQMGRVYLMPPLTLSEPPHTVDRRTDLSQALEERRDKAVFAGRTPRYGVGFISENTLFGPPGPLQIMGYTKPSIPKVIAQLDRSPFPGAVRDTGGTLVHEVGHTVPYELGDTYSYPGATPKSINPVQPGNSDPAGNFLLEKDFPFSPTHARDVNGLMGPLYTSPAQNVYDFMSGGSVSWGDEIEYRVLFEKRLAETLSPSVASARLQAESSPTLIVRGVMNTSGSATLLPLIRVPGPVEPNQFDEHGTTITVELRGASDALLESTTTKIEFIEHRSYHPDNQLANETPVNESPFRALLPDRPEGRKIVIRREEQVLATIERSANAPTITLLAPHGPGTLAGSQVEVRWTATDVDAGSVLHYDVLYTPDGGDTVLPVEVSRTGISSLMVPIDRLPGSDAGRFIVRASDGWNQAEAQSNPPFVIGDRTPVLEIIEPAPASTRMSNVPMRALAMAHDPEDGFLTEGALAWFLDGATSPVGTGINPVFTIPDGARTLKCRATDSFGHVVEAEVQFSGEPPTAGALDIVDYLLGLIPEPARSDRNRDGRIDISDAVEALNSDK